MIRLLDTILDKLNGVGDKHPLIYLAGEGFNFKKNIKALWARKTSFYEENPLGRERKTFLRKA